MEDNLSNFVDSEKIEEFSNLSRQELIEKANEIISNNENLDEVNKEINAIKHFFTQKSKEENEQNIQTFLNENPENTKENYIKPIDELNIEFKFILEKVKEKKKDINKTFENQKLENLEAKKQIIQEIHEMTKGEQTYEKTYQHFKVLQDKWDSLGEVPQKFHSQIYNDYKFNVKKFYEWVNLNKESRDVDLQKNLTQKIEYCKEAEKLLKEKNSSDAFFELQNLHEKWKKVGHVPTEKQDEVWVRFSNISKEINQNYQNFRKDKIEEEKVNLDAKIILCQELELISNNTINNFKDLELISNKINEIQGKWDKIGYVPKKDHKSISLRYKQTLDVFYHNRKEFFKNEKNTQKENLIKKQELIEKAKSIKENKDFVEATREFVKIQNDWKKIGNIPKKYSDSLWTEFHLICNDFFKEKESHLENALVSQTENLKKKKEIIENILNYKTVENLDENISKINEFQNEWTAIGDIPFKEKQATIKEYQQAINNIYDTLNIDEQEKSLIKFKNTLNSIDGKNKQEWIENERNFLIKKKQKIESEIILLDNNMSFFSNSKNADKIKSGVLEKIEQEKNYLKLINEKLTLLRKAVK